MTETIIKPKGLHNRFFHWIGLFILPLNKIRHEIQGYVRARPFDVSEIEKALAYDEQVVAMYLQEAGSVQGKRILELGPGADLGVGMMLLSKGAEHYVAFDVNPLARKAPARLHEAMAQKLGKPELAAQASGALANTPDRLVYIVDPRFDINQFSGKNIDLVLSHAAFEHFDDVADVIKQLSAILPSGARLISEVDLQTHTRWIRQADPLNIYRYSDRVWNLFRFRGSPNRVRPQTYRHLLEQAGFTNVQVKPVIRLEKEATEAVRSSLDRSFQNDSHLDVLSFVLLAQKA